MNQQQGLAPFFFSSVPKSGTQLLRQLLTGMPGVDKKLEPFYLWKGVNQEEVISNHYNRLKKLSVNEFGVGHIVFSQQYADMLRKLNLKHIFIYRDPRDVLVSQSYFIRDKWLTHSLHHAFNTSAYPNTKSRMLALLRGVGPELPFYEFYEPYYQWLHHKDTLSLSYESLMISKESREARLKDLLTFLWENSPMPLPLETMVKRMQLNDNPHTSSTFRKGIIGGWKDEFDEDMKQIFKDRAGQLLVRYGYEKDNTW